MFFSGAPIFHIWGSGLKKLVKMSTFYIKKNGSGRALRGEAASVRQPEVAVEEWGWN